MSDIFWGYSSSPNEIGIAIEAAVCASNLIQSTGDKIVTWPSVFEVGSFIEQNVLQSIDNSRMCFFDITVANYNVLYEIGYAIGKSKPVKIFINKSFKNNGNYINKLGAFDTMGQARYENEDDLLKIIQSNLNGASVFEGELRINRSQPLYLLDSLIRSDFASKIISAIKETKTFYRSFDPKEEYRMSLRREIQEISSSIGVITTILSDDIVDSELHNLRSAFLSGLAKGMEIPVLTLKLSKEPAPLDVRDIVIEVSHPEHISETIRPFCISAMSSLQNVTRTSKNKTRTALEKINLGSSAAENEFKKLYDYFIETASFRSAMQGRGKLVVGRKGSGKSAIFWQVRDRMREFTDNLVLDLKPDGYQIRKFKEALVDRISDGTKEHTVSAFWEYILYLELAQKIIESDKRMVGRNPQVTEELPKVMDVYHQEEYTEEGDFSERFATITREIISKIDQQAYVEGEKLKLSSAEVTEIVYSHDIKKLKSVVSEYLKSKNTIVVLFDNLDKGWNSTGVTKDDLLIARTLIEGLRKVERNISRSGVNFLSLIFLRNDVYELMLDNTPDRGKEASVTIDWGNKGILKEVIDERLKYSTNSEVNSWSDISIPYIDEVDSFDWLIDRCLMRPRYLIDLVDRCIAHAISMKSEQIGEEALREGYRTSSLDIVANINYEIRDVNPKVFNKIYNLQNQASKINMLVLKSIFDKGCSNVKLEEIVDLFLWFGVIGIVDVIGDVKYIYDVESNFQVLQNKRFRKGNEDETFEINRSFWSSLDIKQIAN